MKYMQIAKNKEQTLSVTGQTQNNNFSPNKSAKNSKSETVGTSKGASDQFSGCADGVCQVTWKPLRRSV